MRRLGIHSWINVVCLAGVLLVMYLVGPTVGLLSALLLLAAQQYFKGVMAYLAACGVLFGLLVVTESIWSVVLFGGVMLGAPFVLSAWLLFRRVRHDLHDPKTLY